MLFIPVTTKLKFQQPFLRCQETFIIINFETVVLLNIFCENHDKFHQDFFFNE